MRNLLCMKVKQTALNVVLDCIGTTFVIFVFRRVRTNIKKQQKSYNETYPGLKLSTFFEAKCNRRHAESECHFDL